MDFNSKLIDLVQQNDVVFNCYQRDRKNKVVLDAAWNLIALEMEAPGLLTFFVHETLAIACEVRCFVFSCPG